MNDKTLNDLHWLLCSPPLIAADQLPADVSNGDAALGRQWWKHVLTRVHDISMPSQPDTMFRLGRYAESLMSAALSVLPDHSLYASQLAVMQHNRTLGEFDYLIQPASGGPILHIELAVKIYIAIDTDLGLQMVGPGLRDALILKVAHLLNQQLRLSALPEAKALLPSEAEVAPMLWVRGWIFYRDAASARSPQLDQGHLRGWWRRLGEALPQSQSHSRWRILPRSSWMAADIVSESDLTFDQLMNMIEQIDGKTMHPLMLAEYAPQEKGGTEIARGFLLSPNWPDESAMCALRAKILRAGSAGLSIVRRDLVTQ